MVTVLKLMYNIIIINITEEFVMERLKRTEKNTLTERVLQFGEGNFLRRFCGLMIDKLNKENGGDYGVTIVQPLAGGLVDKLNEQDGRYSCI